MFIVWNKQRKPVLSRQHMGGISRNHNEPLPCKTDNHLYWSIRRVRCLDDCQHKCKLFQHYGYDNRPLDNHDTPASILCNTIFLLQWQLSLIYILHIKFHFHKNHNVIRDNQTGRYSYLSSCKMTYSLVIKS